MAIIFLLHIFYGIKLCDSVYQIDGKHLERVVGCTLEKHGQLDKRIITSYNSSFQTAIDAGKINGAVLCATEAEGRLVYEKAMSERTLLSGEVRSQKLEDVLFSPTPVSVLFLLPSFTFSLDKSNEAYSLR
ncbi:hypothetical protein K450DRAFT_203236 [Umbelopsis ramanniana AG]|uniref:Uncharacterized protein n=1 Tax=Umbelopsis ramanniana AG TaxID=1314678 RepID=A0AAD5E1B9_UMBRA|nr:uncharacterized protein K450DRAFT_203236 [Umbelopsis ramanniana AG]KAI8574989.1 hypothetical protein K450DRAFT_203236 [Umbelopsis ramanniana AG]